MTFSYIFAWFILYSLISLYVHTQIYISAIWINYPSLHTFAYICIYANVSLTCMTHHIFAYMNKLPVPIYLHICKYSFFIYVSILYLHIGINYFALHVCTYNICSNMSLWHIHLYHIFAYFNKLTRKEKDVLARALTFLGLEEGCGD